MKDSSHHLKHIQKKVIKAARKAETVESSSNGNSSKSFKQPLIQKK